MKMEMEEEERAHQKVPKGLIDENGVALNKGNIYIGEISSLTVRAGYVDQFKTDFETFLKSHSKELILGGSMVLTFPGSDITNASFKIVEVIGLTLADMAREDRVNFPMYIASLDQIRKAIFGEGLFEIRRLEIIKAGKDAGWDDKGERVSSKGIGRGDFMVNYMRAALEALLVAKLGEDVLNEVFGRAVVKEKSSSPSLAFLLNPSSVCDRLKLQAPGL
uniref:Uncharacterized protein n=1 Tax=Kalanchoe fedtschenkoi TaxID=63787 RepID=A0A7N0T3H9_KALFE